ncbi:MAG: alpha/beta hydrolase [Planctomycetes bacterium]|nr:alpha/beta hydrolase [Planctomycetota bacterium]
MNTGAPCQCGSGCQPGQCVVSAARSGMKLDFSVATTAFEREAVQQSFSGPRFSSRYFSWGDGPPVILGHGLSDRSDSFIPLAYLLKNRFQCVGWDLPGTHAPADEPLPWIRHKHLSDHLLALCDHLRLAKPVIAGASFGSTVALRTLAMAPGRFSGGVLQGGFAFRPLNHVQRNLVRLARFARGRLMGQMPKYREFLHRANGAEFAMLDSRRWEHLVACAGATPVRTVCHQALLLDKADLRPLLERITVPMLVVCGSNDKVVDHRCALDLMSGLPNARKVTLSDCGHVPCYTDVEALAALMTGFIDGVAGT